MSTVQPVVVVEQFAPAAHISSAIASYHAISIYIRGKLEYRYITIAHFAAASDVPQIIRRFGRAGMHRRLPILLTFQSSMHS